MEEKRIYAAIDLKSFYASVECADRGLDPMTTNLVVADKSRTEKTICLAVSPTLKACGIGGRARLFEAVSRITAVNAERKRKIGGREFAGSSVLAPELKKNPELKADFLIAKPRMARYVEVSTEIYKIYLNYAASEDIHVYSVDEVFIDLTEYLRLENVTAREYVERIIGDVFMKTHITATAGIGENLYLAKVAMDIVAKHIKPDASGARIAEIGEKAYRRLLWSHRPITDFWRVGKGYASSLAEYGMYTMGDVARCSVKNEELLYKLFGVNAELLIDHAWGYEPTTIAEIKAYRPKTSSICSGQVLKCPYPYEKAELIVREMADVMALELTEKRLVTDQIVLDVGYDTENMASYRGEAVTDRYGRRIPKAAHGSFNLGRKTSSSRLIVSGAAELFSRIADKALTVRRLTVTANHVTGEDEKDAFIQLDMFSDPEEEKELEKEKRRQETMLKIKEKFGKNAILRGMNLKEGATAAERNGQIGGHKA